MASGLHTLAAVSSALVPVLTVAGVGAVNVETVGVVTADVRTFHALVDVHVTVATGPTAVLT